MKYSGAQARPRQHEKDIRILLWIYAHLYTDRITVMLLLKLAKSATLDTLRRLRKRGLIARHWGNATSCWLYRLTPAGAIYVAPHLGPYHQGLMPITNPSEMGVHLAGHNLVAQRLAATVIAKYNYRGEILSTRQIQHNKMQLGCGSEERGAWKIPDELFIRDLTGDEIDEFEAVQISIAIEVQQTSEPEHVRAYKLWQYYMALSAEQIYQFVYASTNPAVLFHYEDQWRNRLEEKKYICERHKWITPTNPAKVRPTSPTLDKGEFLRLPHDPYGIGLYPRFDNARTLSHVEDSNDQNRTGPEIDDETE